LYSNPLCDTLRGWSRLGWGRSWTSETYSGMGRERSERQRIRRILIGILKNLATHINEDCWMIVGCVVYTGVYLAGCYSTGDYDIIWFGAYHILKLFVAGNDNCYFSEMLLEYLTKDDGSLSAFLRRYQCVLTLHQKRHLHANHFMCRDPLRSSHERHYQVKPNSQRHSVVN
jgi:hypothetical protein